MSKPFIIILIIITTIGGVLGYYSKNSIPTLSKQIDLKAGTTNINWIILNESYCDSSRGSCRNISSSSSSSSSSWGGSSGGGGK